MVWILAILFVVGGTLAYVALRNAQDFSDANEIIPGVPTKAPKEWAGAHSTEARLHRRLRDSMEALRVNAALDDPSMSGVRTSLEQEALAVDETLIAVAALPKGNREEPLRRVTEVVEAIEATVTSVVLLRGPALDDVERRIADVHTRMRLVQEARSELAALSPGQESLDVLRERLDAPPETAPEPRADTPPGALPGDGQSEPGGPPTP